MTWVGAGIFALFGVAMLALAGNQDFLEGVEDTVGSQIDRDSFTQVVRGMGVALLVWGAAVVVVAFFAWRRRRWARTVLTVMGALYAVAQLANLAASGGVGGLLFVGYVVACILLLWTPPARAWFSATDPPGAAGYQQGMSRPW